MFFFHQYSPCIDQRKTFFHKIIRTSSGCKSWMRFPLNASFWQIKRNEFKCRKYFQSQVHHKSLLFLLNFLLHHLHLRHEFYIRHYFISFHVIHRMLNIRAPCWLNWTELKQFYAAPNTANNDFCKLELVIAW